MGFKQITVDVSKRVNGEFKKVGDMTIHCPTLADIAGFVAGAEIAKDEKGQDKYEDGLPVYVGKEANWVQGAILSSVKAQARNKLNPGTANLKENNKIAENWDELTAEGTRGQGEGLAIAREAKEAFKEWLAKSGLSDGAQNTLNTLFGNRAALSLQQQSTKDKVKARVTAFAEALSEEQATRFERPLQAVLDACEATEDALADL